jgi:hypothetical protein
VVVDVVVADVNVVVVVVVDVDGGWHERRQASKFFGQT